MYRQRSSYPRVRRLLVASTLFAFGCGFALGVWTTNPLSAGKPRDPAAAGPSPADSRLALALLALADEEPALTAAAPRSVAAAAPIVGLRGPAGRLAVEAAAPAAARHTPLPTTAAVASPQDLSALLAPQDLSALLAPEAEVVPAPPPPVGPIGEADGTAGSMSEAPAVEPEPPRVITEQVTVQRGDTLMHILKRAGVEVGEAHAAITSLQEVYDPRRLQAGQAIAIELQSEETEDGGRQVLLAGLSLGLNFQQDVHLRRGEDEGFAAATVDRPLRRHVALTVGSIDDSLYLSAIRAGMPEDALLELIRLFSWDVDFQREIQPNDAFEVMFERISTEDGSEVRGGDLLFANLTLSGRALTAYRYTRRDGSFDYYDGEGLSLRKSLLRTPIDGARLSSGFGPRRHPILGYNKMHRGVDFAAPTGTPIYAAGEGRIVQIGRNGGYGNYVRIQHNDQYATAYAHLQGFAKGLKSGSRVRQGQVIGYLGSTGMSTGPHLHYEVHRNGEQINPLSIKQTVAQVLKGDELARFREHIAAIDARRAELARGTTRVAGRLAAGSLPN